MIAKLNTAKIALKEANWPLVNEILQQLPLSSHGIAEPNLSETEWETVLELAIQILSESDFGQRWEIAKLFPKLGERAIAPLINLLEDETLDLEIRWFVGRILSQFKHPESVLALARLLQQTEEEELSTMAAQALAEIGISAVSSLTELLKNSETRLLATQALSVMRRSETISPLLTVIDDLNPNVRATAIEALGSFHHPQIYPLLIAALKDPAAQVRKEVVVALGYLTESDASQDTVIHLKPLLYDLKPEICQQTVIALGRIGTPDAIATLEPVLQSPLTSTGLKIEIITALGWIETEDALLCLQKALEWGDEVICQEVITVMSRANQPQLKQQAAHILIQFFHSQHKTLQNPSVRQALATSLGELGIEGQEVLEQLAQDDNIRVKLHAVSALKKLTKQQYVQQH